MLPGGKAPEAGDTMRNPALARTLRRIGREGREAFYEGAVARDIVNRLKELGGLHEEEDFAAQRSQWVEPIHASYRGYDVYECPPANQGLTALMILKTLEGYALGGDAFTEADRLHLIAEATKAAYHVRDTMIGDPDFAPVDVETYLSEEWAEATRRQIRLDRALPPQHWEGHRAQGHDLHVRRRSRRQRGVVHQLAVLVVRHRHHGAGKRRHPAQSRQRLPPRSPAIRARSRRGSARSTR